MNKIPTAIELTFQKFPNHNGVFVLRNIEEFMIEFTKLHVEAALRLAAEEAYYGSDCQVNRQNITNIYPLKLIK
jgi:hypothetical protein